MKKLFLLFILCTMQLFADDSATIQDKVEAKNLAEGAKLWTVYCNKCHSFRDPQNFNDEQWKLFLFHMRIRTGLSQEDMQKILTFLQKIND